MHNKAPNPDLPRDGLEYVCEQFREELHHFFERRAPRADAVDDLVQLVYLRLLHSRPDEPVRDPRLFMYRVAWNVLRKENERVRREGQRILTCDAEELARLAEGAGAFWVSNSTEALAEDQLERTLRRLPRAWQIVLVRRYYESRSNQEIAQELKVSVHAVKKYLARALKEIRQQLNAGDA